MEKLNRLSEIYNEQFKEVKKSKDRKYKVIKIYNLQQSKEEEDRLNKEGIDFEISETVTSCKIKFLRLNEATNELEKICLYYLENTKSEYFLILLNELKKEIEGNKDKVEGCRISDNINDIKYFTFSKTINREIMLDAGSQYKLYNVWEADISHAYYRAAFALGFISEALYLKIINSLSKYDRLRLLGCIASTKVVRWFRKGKYFDGTIKRSLLHRSAWFKICHYTDLALNEFRELLGTDFLFYWVDGIYFKYDADNELRNAYFQNCLDTISNKYNFHFKTIPIPLFELTNYNNTFEVVLHKPDGKIKRFFPAKEQIMTYSIIGLNELENEDHLPYDQRTH